MSLSLEQDMRKLEMKGSAKESRTLIECLEGDRNTKFDSPLMYDISSAINTISLGAISSANPVG